MKASTEFKSMPFFVKAVQDRTVAGIFSVFGNEDSVGDIVFPGAFSKTFQERARKTLFLWQHDFSSPPIATIDAVKEVGREALPQEVLSAYPQATGGAEVTRTYLDTPRGNEVLMAIRAGAPLQQSFGFDPIRYDFTESEQKKQVRNLREVKLWEISDVLWGANDATRAQKAWLDLETILGQLEAHVKSMGDSHAAKSGSRHNSSDKKMLNDAHKLLVQLGATNCKGLVDDGEAEAEPDTQVQASAEKEGEGKSQMQAQQGSRAEQITPVSLTQLKQRLAILALSITN